MNKVRLISIGLAVCGFLAAPGVTMADGIKIGVVNALKVLQAAPQADAARKRLEKEFSGRDRELSAEMKAIKVKEDKLAKDGAVMSQEEVQKLQNDIMIKRRDLKRDQDEFRDDVNMRRNEEFGKIQKQIIQTIQAVAKEQGYDLVLGDGVIYADKKVDITNLVIDKLKKSGAVGH